MTRKSAAPACRACSTISPKPSIKPALAIVGEPTLMKVVGAHKGGTARAHALPRPRRPFERAAQGRQRRDDGGRVHRRARADRRRTCRTIAIRASIRLTRRRRRTSITGGTALNILAREARVTWECRTLPGRDPMKVVARAKELAEHEILPKYRAARRRRRSRSRCTQFLSRPRARSGFARRRAGARTLRRQRGRDRRLWHRSRPVRERRHSRRDLRPRLHRPGAQAGRVRALSANSKPARPSCAK